ncbi:helix-turn-helix domain-containing protein [Mycobacterium sp. 236(2023)]|uniref:PucR family transcriptional regulator n=1 Tax=Mycobacterium sp. 236(2023) TaxID=3038163 RepID=UPI0024150A4F|nr:helix-turn-helix domain-containing protein [Mycobacterium sp. 236(2023)]MDG4668117.1 helix-turn-helix domain-containing protein [Mycobacterium sp. 236(2023)]
MADIVSRHVPQLGQGTLTNVLPASMQKSVLSVLVGLRRGSAIVASMGDAELEIMGVCARTGIELTSVFTAIRRGQGVMVERLMQQCRALVDIGEQYPQYQLISELSFTHVDALATQFAQLYENERHRWLNDPLAARVALVNRILAGDDAALAGCSTTLHFEIGYRHHLAVCAWTDRASSVAPGDLEVAALDYLRHNGAAQTMVLHDPNSTLTVWGNARGALAEPLTDFNRREGVHLAVGTPGTDVAGFRATTREARQAAFLATKFPALQRDTAVHFSDVSLISLLSADTEAARQFVERELGSLAQHDDGTGRLRETLEAYLDCHSPLMVAQQLFIARNTVAYRLRRAAEHLGRPIDVRQPELRAALILARALRSPSTQ